MKTKKFNLKENWIKVKDKFMQQYADLIDNDLLFNEGQDDISLLTFYKKILENKKLEKLYGQE